MLIKNAAAAAMFSSEKMGKTTLASGAQMMVGLNAFEPGQEHTAHAHAGQDKLYIVMQGSGEISIAGQNDILSPGDIAFAPAGVEHSVRNSSGDRFVLMVVLAPPPKK